MNNPETDPKPETENQLEAGGDCPSASCSACGGSGMGKPMYRPEIDKVQRDRCYYCQGTGKAKPEIMDMFPHEMLKRAIAPPWRDCPTGTIAYSHTGTNWTKEPDGRWRANGGDAFPTPGADACLVRLPNAESIHPESKH